MNHFNKLKASKQVYVNHSEMNEYGHIVFYGELKTNKHSVERQKRLNEQAPPLYTNEDIATNTAIINRHIEAMMLIGGIEMPKVMYCMDKMLLFPQFSDKVQSGDRLLLIPFHILCYILEFYHYCGKKNRYNSRIYINRSLIATLNSLIYELDDAKCANVNKLFSNIK